MSLQVLIIGEVNRAEASALKEWMPETLRGAILTECKGIAAAIGHIERTQLHPDLIIVIQSHPDEYSRSEVDALGILVPLARWVVCCGAWCESEGRTRQLWPLAVRVPLRSAMSRIRDEWRLLCGEDVSPLPLSGSREEAFAADHPSLTKASGHVSVLVDSPDPEYAGYLCELLADAGHEVHHAQASCDQSPRVILFDLDPWGSARQNVADELQERHPFSQFIGLMSIPEVESIDDYPVIPKLGSQQQILDAILRAVAD